MSDDPETSEEQYPPSSSLSEVGEEHQTIVTPTKRRHVIKAKNVKSDNIDGTVRNSPFARGIDFIGRLSKRSKVKVRKDILSIKPDSDRDPTQNTEDEKTKDSSTTSEKVADREDDEVASSEKKETPGEEEKHRETLSDQSTEPTLVNRKKKSKSKKSEKTKDKKPKVPAKKSTKAPVKSHVLTEYYPVRRSSRKTKSLLEKEQNDYIIEAIESKSEDGLSVVEFEGKGRGVVAKRAFKKGCFIVEYAGDLINWSEAKQREEDYCKDPTVGCYMYYFIYNNTNYCVDATSESGRLGRLLNHSRRNPNCKTKLVPTPNPKQDGTIPKLVIIAKRDIAPGEELTYDYGDRDKETLQSHPWLKST